jgi:DNA-binding transcriptional LysR family regulator
LAVAEISELENPEDFRIEPLLRHPVLLLARAGHPLARLGRAPEVQEVLSFPSVTTAFLAARIGLHIAQARQPSATTTAYPAFPAVVLESVGASLAVAAGSDAITAATAPAAATALRAGALVVLRFQPPWLTTNFGILSLRKRPLSLAAEALATLLRKADAEAFSRAPG